MVQITLSLTTLLLAVNFATVLAAPLGSKGATGDLLERRDFGFDDDFVLPERREVFDEELYARDFDDIEFEKREENKPILFARETDFELNRRGTSDLEKRGGFFSGLASLFGFHKHSELECAEKPELRGCDKINKANEKDEDDEKNKKKKGKHDKHKKQKKGLSKKYKELLAKLKRRLRQLKKSTKHIEAKIKKVAAKLKKILSKEKKHKDGKGKDSKEHGKPKSESDKPKHDKTPSDSKSDKKTPTELPPSHGGSEKSVTPPAETPAVPSPESKSATPVDSTSTTPGTTPPSSPDSSLSTPPAGHESKLASTPPVEASPASHEASKLSSGPAPAPESNLATQPSTPGGMRRRRLAERDNNVYIMGIKVTDPFVRAADATDS